MKDKITVNIACYSKSNPEYLAETIQSIRSQGIEPIAVPDERVTTDKWDEAIENCKTPYIHLATHDDIYLPGFYDEVVSWLDAHPDASAVFTMDYIINEKGNRIGQTNLPFKPRDTYDHTFLFNQMVRHGNFLRSPSKCLRVEKVRGLIHPLGSCDSANDTAHHFLCLTRGPVGIIPKKLYCYRDHAESDTRRNVLGTYRAYDHIRAMKWSLWHHPDKENIDWEALVNLSRNIQELGVVEEVKRLKELTDTATVNTFVVAHEPPDNAGTGVLVADRVRKYNKGSDKTAAYYVYPVQGDKVEVSVEKGCPVIRCPAFGFSQIVDKFKPHLIEYHHILRWPLDILEKRDGIRQEVYLHDAFLWCSKAHMINHLGDICDGPGESRCHTCMELSPADYAAKQSDLAKYLPKMDGIYANSEWTLAMASKYLPEGLNIRVNEFPVPELPLYAKRKRIGYFGYFSPTKGIHTLLQAMMKVTGAQLLLFCDVPKEFLNGRRLHGFDNTLVMGPYRRDDLPVLCNLIDVGVVPSLIESFGLVGRELELLGMSCIKTGTGGQTGTIEPGDVDALAKAIQEAVDA